MRKINVNNPEKQRELQNEVRYWTEEEIEPIISDYLRGAEHYGGMIARLRCLKPKSLEKQEEPIDKEKVLIGARKDVAFSIMDFLDRNTLGMCLSNMECKDLEDAIVDSDWSKVYNYMKKKLEKQGQKETTWNKEDEENMNNVIYIFNQLKDNSPYKEDDIAEKTINWLKSLKDRLCSNNELSDIEKQSKESKVEEAMREVEEKAEAFTAAHQGENADVILAEMRGEIKPKFHEGDWISGYYTNYRVTEINSKGYVVEDTDGNKINILFENEKFHHLFTIADAKNGDVLVVEEDGKPFIFRDCPDTNNPNALVAYCGIDCANRLIISTDDQWWTDEKVCPATKGQRDTLERAITNAGYRWDEKKKELKKLTQQEVTKISDQVKDSDWSEEDEIIYAELIKYFESLLNCLATKERHNENGRWLNWLKSLKFRKQWKPSEEQMNALAEALILAKNCGEENAFDLRTLYEQLKKL